MAQAEIASAHLPFTPGSYRLEGQGESKREAFCRLGPGGRSLVIEDGSALTVITTDGGKVHVDRFGDDGVARFDGALEGGTLVAAGGGRKLTMAPEGDAVVVHLGDTPPQRWERTAAAPATRGSATGIGGVFFKAKDHKKLFAWYVQHLGLPPSPYGFADLRWRELNDPARVAHTAWSIFKPEGAHFDGPFMIDYRVDDLDALLQKLAHDGIKPEKQEDDPATGRFAWIRDGEGNLVELWQPRAGG